MVGRGRGERKRRGVGGIGRGWRGDNLWCEKSVSEGARNWPEQRASRRGGWGRGDALQESLEFQPQALRADAARCHQAANRHTFLSVFSHTGLVRRMFPNFFFFLLQSCKISGVVTPQCSVCLFGAVDSRGVERRGVAGLPSRSVLQPRQSRTFGTRVNKEQQPSRCGPGRLISRLGSCLMSKRDLKPEWPC